MSFKLSINFSRVQNVLIRGSSSAVLQSLGECDIKYGWAYNWVSKVWRVVISTSNHSGG